MSTTTDVTSRPRGPRGVTWGLPLMGIGGLAVAGIAAWADPRQAAFSYLMAYTLALSFALGALLFLMIQHAIGATWSIVFKRPAEAVAGTLPLLALLIVPVFLGWEQLFPWLADTGADVGGVADRDHVYLSIPFAAARAIVYFLVWCTMAFYLRRQSSPRSVDDGEALVRRRRMLCALGLPPVAFAVNFASFDWLMSLTPGWSSSIFGVYLFAGAMVAFLSLLCVAAHVLDRRGILAGSLTVSHYHALGKLLLTFLIFWGYIGYSQYLIIWIADLPAENVWYIVRSNGTWAAVSLALIIGHFLIPFSLLLSRRLKRNPAGLAAVGAWLLLMHALDVYWMVMPSLHAAGIRPHWVDAATLIGVGGIVMACAFILFGRVPAVAADDPRYARAIRFVTD